MKKENVLELGKNITISGYDLTRGGLGQAVSKLARLPGLEVGTKVRVAAIYREIGEHGKAFDKDYTEAIKDIKFEGEGQNRKCLDEKALNEINEKFEERSFVVTGRKIPVSKIDIPQITAADLNALLPILDGVE
jgi:hypothetical protein